MGHCDADKAFQMGNHGAQLDGPPLKAEGLRHTDSFRSLVLDKCDFRIKTPQSLCADDNSEAIWFHFCEAHLNMNAATDGKSFVGVQSTSHQVTSISSFQ